MLFRGFCGIFRKDGRDWSPGKHTRICNAHFIGQRKSDNPKSLAYNPTIFSAYTDNEILENPVDQENGASMDLNSVHLEPMDLENNEIFIDKEIQVELINVGPDSNSSENTVYLVCNRFVDVYHELNHVEIQTDINIAPKSLISGGVQLIDRLTQTDPYIISKEHQPSLKCESGFHGHDSLQDCDSQTFSDLCGVSSACFELLLKVYLSKPQNTSTRKIKPQDKLLMFIMKMKWNLTYSALGVLFKIHRTTASKIFLSVLVDMCSGCQEFVHWPSREVVDSTMPIEFLEKYSKCRVIIDCTEFRTEQPAGIDKRVFFYSHYKKGFRLKVLVGCTPGGFISFVSKCFGGKTTDAQITIQSGLIDKLEPGDMVLADKGFPEIKSLIDSSGKNCLLVMPPFLDKAHFTAEERGSRDQKYSRSKNTYRKNHATVTDL